MKDVIGVGIGAPKAVVMDGMGGWNGLYMASAPAALSGTMLVVANAVGAKAIFMEILLLDVSDPHTGFKYQAKSKMIRSGRTGGEVSGGSGRDLRATDHGYRLGVV